MERALLEDPRLRRTRAGAPEGAGGTTSTRRTGKERHMTQFALRATLAALGLWLATVLVGGISIVDPLTLVLAAVLLGLCNAVVKPVLIILTLPATVLSLGLFLLVINGAVLALVAWML